ncbi:uncharacterized protein LOC121366104 [Gigantopelta aegis]|uniref:uncharacterized protein LOC121366104 n=1 Tax=Gigantopelta aegis TaxID=1735272 RepID=UPI001B88CD3C|nr:uncharacterized protein LOC121366104 [Gigantopelta aegis]
MRGVKRKASRFSPYERPSKMKKNDTIDTISNKLSLLKTVSKAPMAPLKFPNLRRKRTSTKMDKDDSTSGPTPPKRTALKRKRTAEDVKVDDASGLPLPNWPTLKRRRTTKEMADDTKQTAGRAPPGLRRAPTMPLPEKESPSSEIKTTKSLSKKRSSLAKKVSKKCKSDSSQ